MGIGFALLFWLLGLGFWKPVPPAGCLKFPPFFFSFSLGVVEWSCVGRRRARPSWSRPLPLLVFDDSSRCHPLPH
ncbi:hypothetical protein B0H14DRAFT_2720073 [Mycena olivaceomarginata]|nr:hypothetical protein B0H14DRAFT_2720073 [Mycena olivaceomarginata]